MKIKKENWHCRHSTYYMGICVLLGFFLFAPSNLGAYYLSEAEALGPAKGMQATSGLEKSHQPIYEIDGKLYRVDDHQVLVPLTPEEKQLSNYSPTAKPQDIKIKVSQDIKEAFGFGLEKSQESTAYPKSDKKELRNDKLREEGIALQPENKGIEIQANNPAEDLAKKDPYADREQDVQSQLQGAEIPKPKADAVSLQAKAKKKMPVLKDQLRLEGMPEDADTEDDITITPKIKVQGIYQESSLSQTEQKTGNYFPFNHNQTIKEEGK